MRMGHSSAENNVDDVRWWKQHNKEINFAFRVLVGLGLAKMFSEDEEEMERRRQQGPLEAVNTLEGFDAPV
jgi:hypothetical protein